MTDNLKLLLQKTSIVSYLEENNHRPVKVLTGGKLSYRCPFPDHQERKPSFMVYTNSDYENFHCYGCGRGYNIIHLISGMEQIPYRDVLKRISDKLNLNISESTLATVDEVMKYCVTPTKESEQLEQSLLSISHLCRFYLDGVKHNPDEVKKIDELWRDIDNHIANYEFEDIYEILKQLPRCLHERRENLA